MSNKVEKLSYALLSYVFLFSVWQVLYADTEFPGWLSCKKCIWAIVLAQAEDFGVLVFLTLLRSVPNFIVMEQDAFIRKIAQKSR
ncbi:hypothetical protein [Burkholderia ubonensis]|uniref:hypothetical protein n=1 Tax=Burkholderia ubonensis TaxID=101571 RepID=UPI002ABE92B2|nr:hypothetical protein [Burkholderia ubonensis]